MFSYYPQRPEWNDAAVLLDMMSADQIAKIVSLVNARGTSVISDIKSKDRMNSLSVMAILDERYVPSEDLEMVALGLSTVLLSQIRKPKMGNDEYQVILQDAFALPGAMAEVAAKRIETEDILGSSYKDPQGALLPWYEEFSNAIREGTRKMLNAVPEILTVPWEIDQDQSYDLDLLYEYKLLGGVVSELNSRARLMAGQAALNQTMGLMQTGDVEGLGDAEQHEIAVGDAVRHFSLRNLPKTVFGGMLHLRKVGKRHSHALASQMSAASGIKASKGGALRQTKPGHPGLKAALDKALSAKPTAALALGGMFGAAPMAIKLAKSLFSHKATGDVDSEVGDVIANDYGHSAARAWLMGDVEGMMHAIQQQASDDITTGDPDLDDAIEASIHDAHSGDVDTFGPEVGGLFMRARINRAKKKYAKHTRANKKRAALQHYKDMDADSAGQDDGDAGDSTDDGSDASDEDTYNLGDIQI